jgi:hypothetical protein
MATAKKTQPKPAPAEGPAEAERTDYTRCGGHVLTDHGWVLEDQVEALGAKPTRVEEG